MSYVTFLTLSSLSALRSIRLILSRWNGRGAGRELQRLVTLLEAGTAERALYEVCAAPRTFKCE